MRDQNNVEEVEVVPVAKPIDVEDIGGDAAVVTVPAIRTSTSGVDGVAGSVGRLMEYATASDRFARASLAMQVMAGFELSDVRKAAPFTQGRKPRAAKYPHDAVISENAHKQALSAQNDPFAGFSTWEDWLKGTVGISADTAGRWMAMADAVRPRLKKLDGWASLVRDLMERPIADLEPAEIEVLGKAVAKICDGRTQLDFLQELGIVKRPGNPSLGGSAGGRAAASGPVDDSAIIRSAEEDWATIHRGIAGGSMSFSVLADADIEAQIDWLSRAIRVRREWLSTPTAQRTSATIDTLSKVLR